MSPGSKLIIALDTPDVAKARALAETLQTQVGLFKVGYELMYSMLASFLSPGTDEEALKNLAEARALCRMLQGKLFWDMKLADIPSTARAGYEGAAALRAVMVTVHASAGVRSLRAVTDAAKEMRDQLNRGPWPRGFTPPPKVLAVTMLTSLDDTDADIVFGSARCEKVTELAFSAKHAGADGIVCSAGDLRTLLAYNEFSTMIRVVAGVRPSWAEANDQKNIVTPREAILAGADYLVIGRPVTQPPAEIGTPTDAVARIWEEIEDVLPSDHQ